MAGYSSFNYAAGLPQVDNTDLRVLFSNLISTYVIANYRHTLPLNAIMPIGMSVDLCGSKTFLVEDDTETPDFNDTAVDSFVNRRVFTPPRTISFNGWVKSAVETKLSVEQWKCIQQSEILRNWFSRSIDKMVADGKDAIMARFYRHLLTHVPAFNTGLKAGMPTRS